METSSSFRRAVYEEVTTSEWHETCVQRGKWLIAGILFSRAASGVAFEAMCGPRNWKRTLVRRWIWWVFGPFKWVRVAWWDLDMNEGELQIRELEKDGFGGENQEEEDTERVLESFV